MSYTKVRPEDYPFEVFKQDINGVVSLYDSGIDSANNTFTGDYLPEWHELIKVGAPATTLASGLKETLNPGFIDFFGIIASIADPSQQQSFGVTGTPRHRWWRDVGGAAPDSTVTEVTNRAISKFLDTCDNARSSIEFGQDLGEWKETVRSVIHPLQSLREFTFSHLAKVTKLTQKVKHKASLTKMVGDTWLEFKFGWNPLAADVGKAVADLTNNSQHQKLQAVRGSAKGDYPIFEQPFFGYVPLGIAILQMRTLVTGSYFVTFKGAIKTGAVGGHIPLLQNLQLDLPHFLPTVWDLLPYSWIVDYFVNVGDIIRSLSFRFTDLAWGQMTVRNEHQYNWQFTWDINNFDQDHYVVFLDQRTADNPSGTRVSFSRGQIQPGSLIPKVNFSLPLGSAKPWENLAALFAGRQKEITRLASNIR